MNIFCIPPAKFLVCGGDLKSFIPPLKKFCVCVWGGLKTETGKFHEILTVFFYYMNIYKENQHFFIPPQIFNVWGGLKT